MMLPEILLYILLFFSFFTIDSFAVTPPQDRRCPRDFRLEIDHDSSVQHYGDPGWVNKMQKRKQIREDIALEKIAYEFEKIDEWQIELYKSLNKFIEFYESNKLWYMNKVNSHKVKDKPKKRLDYLLGFYNCLRISEVVNLKKEFL